MGRIHDDDIGLLGPEFLCPFQVISFRADRRADAKPSLAILRRMRELAFLLDVLDRDEPLEHSSLAYNEELLDPVFMQQLLRVLQGGAHRHGDELFLGHHLADLQVVARFEAQVAVGENADQLAVLGHGDAGDPVARHQVEGFADPLVAGNRDRVDDHARFAALDAVDFFRLPLNGHVAVDDAEAALPGQGDRQPGLGDRVHRGAQERNLDFDAARNPRGRVDLGGQNRAVGGQKENVVEGERERQRVGDHATF